MAAAVRAEVRSFAGKAVLFTAGKSLLAVLQAEAAVMAEVAAGGGGSKKPTSLPCSLTVDALFTLGALGELLAESKVRGGPTLLPLLLGSAYSSGDERGEYDLTPTQLLHCAFQVSLAATRSSGALVRHASVTLAAKLGERAFALIPQ